jgi:hypothetical protein
LSETPATEPATQSDDVETDGPSAVHCRHCGQPNEVNVDETPDWLCPACERYQDATTCPVCHQLARISMLPPDMVPEPHAPARRRRSQ